MRNWFSMPSSTISSDLETEPETGRTRVLLVDDNQAVLARVASVLQPACTVVGQVQDGAAALAASARLQPDVIVLDISMPGMSGLEVAARLREVRSTAAIVFLTVHADAEVAGAAHAAGGIGYVVKRKLGTDLLHAVNEARARRPFVSVFD
jgi:NarL family two-component system response regulator LiaR